MAAQPTICAQSLSKIAMDMFRLCRFHPHVMLLEKSEKVVADRNAAVRDLRLVLVRLQMSTKPRQIGINRHEHLLGVFQGVPHSASSDYANQKLPKPAKVWMLQPFLRIIRSFT